MYNSIEDKILQEIAKQHISQQHDCMLGMNFVECFTCHWHGHAAYGHGYVIHHNSDYTINERISQDVLSQI